MKRLLLLVIGIVLTAPLYAIDLDQPYEISRREWLEYEASKSIKERTDLWETRTAISVILVEEDGSTTMSVVIVTANGETPPSEDAKKRYEETVRAVVQRVLDKYEWASDIGVLVRYLA